RSPLMQHWGAVRREWVAEQHERIAAALEYPTGGNLAGR
ncbi:hypothetical protein AAIH51_35620, partial [Pseudomonas aeruginosa]